MTNDTHGDGQARGTSRVTAAAQSLKTTISYLPGRLFGLLHEQYESDGQLVLFRCTECGYTSMSLGSLHAHIERHRGYTRFNIQIPLTKTAMGDFEKLMELTEVVRVDDEETVALEEVDDYA